MENKLFKRGDVVKHLTLKIKMVVDCTDEKFPEKVVWCIYYDTNEKRVHYKDFDTSILKFIKHDDRTFIPKTGQAVCLKSGNCGFVVRDIDGEDISVAYQDKYSEYYNRNLWIEDKSLLNIIRSWLSLC